MCWYENTQIPIIGLVMDMPVRVLGSVRILMFFGIHYQNCTKLQGTNLHKLPVLVMRPKEEVQY